MRTILVHVNVELADDDKRSADEIGELVADAIELVLPTGTIALAEEV